ncbi:MAG: aminotransferase class I/II-fold pyridoxal phosphate-dependent enzyme [Actinomycetota bacterium]
MTDPRLAGTTGRLLDSLGPLFDFFTESPWAKKRKEPGACDFLAGNPQEMPLPEFVEALQRAAVPKNKDWYAYKLAEPEPMKLVAESLREERGIEFEDEDVVLTTGAFAGLAITMRTVVDPGDEVIFLSPPWFFYESMIVAAGAEPVRVPIEPPDFDLPVDAIAAAITEKTRAIIVNSPQNPTGRIYPGSDLQRLADVLTKASERNGRPIYLISDEAYCKIVYDDRDFPSPTDFYPNSFLVYTYGKTLLTPGQRFGYIALPPTMPDRDRMRPAVLVTAVVAGWLFPTALMQHALPEIDGLSIDIKALQARRDRMVEALRGFGYETTNPEGTFYLVVRSPDPDDRAFTLKLSEDRVYVLPGSLFELPGFFRISITANDDMVERSLPVFEKAIAG